MKESKPSESQYSLIDRLIHRIALGSQLIREVSFDLERLTLEKGESTSIQDAPVYVCGLARSGTTMLLRVLENATPLASLNYRDMPFIMAPNLWGKVSKINSKKGSISERAHGDGIAVSYDSPEAFEEVFWKTFCKNNDEEPSCYSLEDPTDEVMSRFSDYRKAVIISKKDRPKAANPSRYLSKNNNNIIRINSLLRDKSSRVLLAYRDPIETAVSLHSQHKRFQEQQTRDPFTLEYMNWLGHHEFGINQKPFLFACDSRTKELSPDQLEYWLHYWNNAYTRLLENDSDRIHLIHHESLRTNPSLFIELLLKELDIKEADKNIHHEIKPPSTKKTKNEINLPGELAERSQLTYQKLLNDKRNILVTENYK